MPRSSITRKPAAVVPPGVNKLLMGAEFQPSKSETLWEVTLMEMQRMNEHSNHTRTEIERLKAETEEIKADNEVIKARLQSRLDALQARFP